jgi:hypothetical protein
MKLTRSTTNSFPRRIPVLETALAVTLIALSGSGFAAKGGDPGPPTGGETSNNLSTPSIQTESATSVEAYWAVPENPVLGEHYSYGCDKPQSDGQFSYPNTSCVDSLSAPTIYYNAAECQAIATLCAGLPVTRIYWQKVEVNEWWADDDGISNEIPPTFDVAYIDWGDALEAVSWNERSVIRTETQPWGNRIPGFDPTQGMVCADVANDAAVDCKTGYQMWHVSGQGITEHWGARATDDDAAVPYHYESPFQIIKTTEARLNLTKLVPESAVCPQPGGNPNEGPPDVTTTWTGSGWTGTCQWYDAPYSVETSVGGKYVYGYNWRMKDVNLEGLCPGWTKTGYWRMTFYAPDDVIFNDDTIPNVAPPAVPPVLDVQQGSALVMSTESEDDEEGDDRLFAPIVDKDNNLTYIDICIVAKEGGGGGGGGGGPGGGGGGGGGGGHNADATAAPATPAGGGRGKGKR